MNSSALHVINSRRPEAGRSARNMDFGAAVWRADALAANTQAGKVLPTGHAPLDAQLPGGGWPLGALCEILQSHSAQSEWRLLLPALVVAQQGHDAPDAPGKRRLPVAGEQAASVVLIDPPHAPFGPALAAQGLDVQHLVWVKAQQAAQRLWATEQALACSAVVAVLAWLPQVQSGALRRLHMAAQTHAKLLFVMRPAQAQQESSPAPLRLLMLGTESVGGVSTSEFDALNLQVLKRRGPPLSQSLRLHAHQLNHHGALDRVAA